MGWGVGEGGRGGAVSTHRVPLGMCNSNYLINRFLLYNS